MSLDLPPLSQRSVIASWVYRDLYSLSIFDVLSSSMMPLESLGCCAARWRESLSFSTLESTLVPARHRVEGMFDLAVQGVHRRCQANHCGPTASAGSDDKEFHQEESEERYHLPRYGIGFRG